MMQTLLDDQLILMMTETLRESMRLGEEEGSKTCELLLASELALRQVVQLPLLDAAKLLDVPHLGQRPRQTFRNSL